MDNLELGCGKTSAASNDLYGRGWGLLEQVFTSVASRARAREPEEATNWSFPGICNAFQWYFAWQCLKSGLRKLEDGTFRDAELVHLAMI